MQNDPQLQIIAHLSTLLAAHGATLTAHYYDPDYCCWSVDVDRDQEYIIYASLDYVHLGGEAAESVVAFGGFYFAKEHLTECAFCGDLSPKFMMQEHDEQSFDSAECIEAHDEDEAYDVFEQECTWAV